MEQDGVLAIVDAALDEMGHADRISYFLLKNRALTAFAESGQCYWSKEDARPGIDFEIIARARDPESLRFLLGSDR